MRKSLSFKMLILTFGSFLILIFFIAASVYMYFDRFYEPMRIKHMVKAIKDFTSSMENSQWSEEQLYAEVSEFIKKNDVSLSINSGIGFSAVRSITEDFGYTRPRDIVLWNNRMKHTVPYYPSMYQYIRDNKVPFLPYPPARPAASPVFSVSGYSMYGSGTAANINGNVILYPVHGTYAAEINSPYQTNFSDGVFYTISNIPNTNYRQINLRRQSTLDNGQLIFTNVRASLQTVDEVMAFIRGFFPFVIGTAILLSILMAAVYSKIISRPIVNITNTANRMADMELGIVSTVSRRDELGALSSSLNTLSANLKNALDDLSHANEQLKEDYENELRQEQARKEFVANVSHELKTPLGIIKSYSEGLRDGVKTEKREYYLQVVLDEITHMDRMILEMLEISRFDAGAVVFAKKAELFGQLLDKKIRWFTDKAKEKEVTFEIKGNFGYCLMDEAKIGEVLDNLLWNAVKYCNPKSTITIRGGQAYDSLTVNIKNDCPPFSDEMLTKIWDRFYKGDISHNRDTEGTGLGLAITKSILEGHGSSYGVRRTDRGICFYFTLDREEQ